MYIYCVYHAYKGWTFFYAGFFEILQAVTKLI